MNALAEDTQFPVGNARTASVSNDETYWGYIVRCESCDRSLAIIMQWAAAFVGVSLLVAAAGFWALPGSALSQDVAGFKLAMSALLGVFGVTLVWFASHGTQYELQVDLVRLEVREVLRNAQGIARVQNRVLFEEVGAVFIDRAETENTKSRLLLRLGNTTQVIEVARDYEEHLTRLRDRMGRDILGKNIPLRKKPSRGFILDGAKGVVNPEMVA